MKKIDPQVLLDDLRRVFAKVGARNFVQAMYCKLGRHSSQSCVTYFGGWNQALAAAGLPVRPQGRPRRQDPFVALPDPILTRTLSSYKKLTPLLVHRPGRRQCLKCERLFVSWDVTKNRICFPCNKGNEGLDDEPTVRLLVAR